MTRHVEADLDAALVSNVLLLQLSAVSVLQFGAVSLLQLDNRLAQREKLEVSRMHRASKGCLIVGALWWIHTVTRRWQQCTHLPHL